MTKRSPLTFNSENINPLKNEETSMISNTQTLKHLNKKSREGRRFLAAHVSHETTKQMGLLALQSGRTKQDILIEAINDLFAKHGLSRIADE
jgi:hypothetical protein